VAIEEEDFKGDAKGGRRMESRRAAQVDHQASSSLGNGRLYGAGQRLDWKGVIR
jgi:hypothetical protein